MSKKTIAILSIVIFAILGYLVYIVYSIDWSNTPKVSVWGSDIPAGAHVTLMNQVACKVPGALCWRPARGYFDYDTDFLVYKKDNTCKLDYSVEEKNDKSIFLSVSEVDCNLKGSDAKDWEVFTILNIIDQRELSKLHFTYKFHDGSPDSHNIINLVK